MVHSVSNTKTWSSSRQPNDWQQLANQVLRDQECLYNAAQGVQCRPFENMPARDVGLALRHLADNWLYVRQVGYQMRTIADEVNARHQRGRNRPT